MINDQMVHKNAVLTSHRVSPHHRNHCNKSTCISIIVALREIITEKKQLINIFGMGIKF
jgi:hypothetical protein